MPYGPIDAFAAQTMRRLGDDVGISLVVRRNRQALRRRRFEDADDAGRLIAVEDRAILGDAGRARGVTHRIEVGVARAAPDRFQLIARDLERHAQLGQRQHAAQSRDRAFL